MNYEVLKVIPTKWIIDETEVTKNPLWLQWRKLELHANIFMIPSNIYKELEKIFYKLEIDVVDFIPNILWLEEACLDSETRDLWWVLIDIWTNQTSYVIYEDGMSLWYWVIPVWWEEITKDVSIWLKIDYNQAEQVKKEEWEIILDDDTKNDEETKIDSLFLSDIIEARLADDIYKPILEKMEELGVLWKLPGGIILSGWGSKIRNIEEFTRNYFSLSCKRWKVSNNKYQDIWTNLQFLNAIWNYLWEEKYWESSKWFSFGLNFGFLSKIVDWIKKIF
jgi:cell division protein FtsA